MNKITKKPNEAKKKTEDITPMIKEQLVSSQKVIDEIQTMDLFKREDKRMDEPGQALERARNRVDRSFGRMSRGSEDVDVFLESQS